MKIISTPNPEIFYTIEISETELSILKTVFWNCNIELLYNEVKENFGGCPGFTLETFNNLIRNIKNL